MAISNTTPLGYMDPSNAPLHILVVDDEADFGNVFAKELSVNLGYKTTVAPSGFEAVKLLENPETHFDILLLDYDMKGMDGLGVLRWMAERKNEVPVIMLTGAGSEEVAVEAMKLGAYDYVRKEEMDFAHLGVVIQATHERRMFRIARAIEEERILETGLTDQATKQMRDVVGAISHTIHSSFSVVDSQMREGEARALKISPQYRPSLQSVFHELQKHVDVLESSLQGFLRLYKLVYAHHAGRDEIQMIQKEFMEKVAPATK
ncbi:MAG: response regulator [Ignavibacteriae bacterium]|nr:response regulator [Ignavibacteriota bacterium]